MPGRLCVTDHNSRLVRHWVSCCLFVADASGPKLQVGVLGEPEASSNPHLHGLSQFVCRKVVARLIHSWLSRAQAESFARRGEAL